METIIKTMLKRYDLSKSDKENVVKEILQEIALSGLSRGGFFKEAVFLGGTCLRIFHGLDRFSEDLDFSLKSSDPSFDLSKYFPFVLNELRSCGLNASIDVKKKTFESGVKKAYLKVNRNETMSTLFGDDFTSGNKEQTIKIKIEVDIDPPSGAIFEEKTAILPYPCSVSVYDMPTLFASKLHAVIFRKWKSRVKGRDLFDYLYYVGLNTPINKEHLRRKIIRSEKLGEGDLFEISDLKDLLMNRFDSLDYEEVKKDVIPFVSNERFLDNWSRDLFIDTIDRLKFI